MYFPHNQKGVGQVCSLQAAQGVLVCGYEPPKTKRGKAFSALHLV